jgi:hypothetical protein
MGLKEILESAAEYTKNSGFSVNVDELLPTVDIEGEDEDEQFFMQEHEAQQFIDEAEELYNNSDSELDIETIYYALAQPYIESLL